MALQRGTARNILVFESGTDSASYNIGTPTISNYIAGRLYVMAVVNQRAAGPTTPSAPAGWTAVPATGLIAYGAQRQVTLFIRQPTTDTATGAITVAFGGVTQLNIRVHIEEFAGVFNSAATNGTLAIDTRDTATVAGSGTLTGLTIPTSVPAPLFIAYAAWASDGGANAISFDAGWTELAEGRVTSGGETNVRMLTGYTSGAVDTTATASTAGTPTSGGIGMQILPSLGPVSQPLGSGNGTNVASQATGSISPTANTLLLANVYNRQAGTDPPPVPQLTNGGTLAGSIVWEVHETLAGGGSPVVLEEVGDGATGSGSVIINVPVGTVDGDLLVAMVTATSGTPGNHADWTEINSGAGVRGYWRIASSEPSDYTFTGTGNMQGRIFRYSNFNASSPIFDDNQAIGSDFGTPISVTSPSTNAGFLGAALSSGGANLFFLGASGYTQDAEGDTPEYALGDALSAGTMSATVAAGSPLGSIVTVLAIAIAPVGNTTPNERVTLLRAVTPSLGVGSGAVTAGFSGLVQEEVRIDIVEFGLTDLGSNGADAILQTQTGDGSITFDTWDTLSAGYVAGRDPVFGDGSHWWELTDNGDSFDGWRQDQDLTFTGSGLTLVIGLEIHLPGVLEEQQNDLPVELDVAIDVVQLIQTVVPGASDVPVEFDVIIEVRTPPPAIPGRGPLGRKKYRAFIARQGGGTLLESLKVSALSFDRRLSDMSTASLTAPIAGQKRLCREQLADLTPFRDEIIITCNDDIAWVGIPDFPTFTHSEVKITARDLSAWLDVRWLAESHSFDGTDLSTIFQTLFEEAMAQYARPNLSLSLQLSQIPGAREYDVMDRRNVGEELRELTRSGLNYTTIAREIRVGPTVGYNTGIKLLPKHINANQVDIVGIGVATEVAVIGERTSIQGHVGGSDDELGLVQVSQSEPRIRDTVGAQAAAISYRDQSLRPPQVLTGKLLHTAPCYFEDLVPGNIFDVRAEVGLREVVGLMKLARIGFNANGDIDVTLTSEDL